MASNGSNGWTWKIMTAILIPAFFALTSAVVANDKESRTRDEKITEVVSTNQVEMKDDLTQIKVMMASVSTDLKYLREEAASGRRNRGN